ncbi:MAG: geranylgeranyl reductase family protein [Alcanivoracaceae bacterium]|nr:geranylgeranyl reductase family protein [Alcanivoracaceae bacterium]
MKQVDVIVVGAGQAGCAAAYDLASAGLSVLMLDRHASTGHKPCAGGVTEKARRLYRFPLDSVVRETVSQMQMSLYQKLQTPFTADTPFCLMTHRPELDQLCRQHAQQAGASLTIVRHISGFQSHPDGIVLTVDGEQIGARYLIGADGAHGAVRRLAFGGGARHGAMAIEGLLSREQCSRYPQTTFDFGVVRGGYGWMFPKGDHVNVGLYIRTQSGGKVDRHALADYARQRLGSDALTNVQGFPLGTWGHQQRLAAGRVLLVGDAAGFTEPLLGEGIYGAVLSGQRAAAAILAGHHVAANYITDMDRWRSELRRVHPIAAVFYSTLPLSFGVLKHGARRPLMNGYAKGLTLVQSKRLFFGAHFTQA